MLKQINITIPPNWTKRGNETWLEIHAIIPCNKKNFAYNIWVEEKKDIILSILKGIN